MYCKIVFLILTTILTLVNARQFTLVNIANVRIKFFIHKL